MDDLSIYLGSSAKTEGDATTPVVVATPTLSEAVKQQVDKGPWNSLHITVAAHEFATAWSNPMDLASIKLNEAAVVTVAVTGKITDANDILQVIHTAFLLAGLQGTSERKEADGTRVLTAQKNTRTSQPATAQAIALLPKKTQATSNNTHTAVTISLDDDDAEAGMIDEDDLLQDEGDLAPDMNGVTAAAVSAADDCGGRTACDNCTCGRAEQEQAGRAANKQPIQTSACGKCGLGDAFRCASCPYLGKPAFKAGEEHLVLELHDDF